MLSVTTITSSANDTSIPSPCRLISTHCKCQWATYPESISTPITQLEVYVLIVCLNFGQHNFSAFTAGLLHPYRNFGSCCGSLTLMFQAFHPRGLTTPSCSTQHTLIIISLYVLNNVSFIGRRPKYELITHSPRMVNNHTVHPHPTQRDVTVHMNAMMPIHIFNSNDSYTIIFHIILTIMLTHQFSMHQQSHSPHINHAIHIKQYNTRNFTWKISVQNQFRTILNSPLIKHSVSFLWDRNTRPFSTSQLPK